MRDYEWFKQEFYKISTIDLNYYKEKQMLRRINSFIKKYELDNYEAFLQQLINSKDIYDSFINFLTINVSEFYRNPAQWELLDKEIIPMLIERKGSLANINIWSSACSTGDEPYTLVMLLNKRIPLNKINILATDIDKTAIQRAKRGVYPSRSLKDLPKSMLEKYFTKDEWGNFKINDEVKNCVNFKNMNLLRDKYPNNIDLIVCRNVLIYFTEQAKNKIYKDFNSSLVDDGILFLGSTEQIINPNKYGYNSIRTFFYKKINGI